MQHEYRYAMYNRPVWGALSLSQPYTLDGELTHPDIIENRKYYNRSAWSVLITNHPLTAQEIKNLEMVDIAADNKQRAHKAELVEYINTLDGVSDSGKIGMVSMVETGKYIKNKADVDKYADKYMAQGTRSARKQTTEKPPGERFKTRPRIRLPGGGPPLYANFATSTDVSYEGRIYKEKYRYRYGSLQSAEDDSVQLGMGAHTIVIDFGEGAGISRYGVFCSGEPIPFTRIHPPTPHTATKPAPDLPPALTAPPELAADVLGAGQTPVQAAPKPKKQPAARKQTTEKPPGERFKTRPQILPHGFKGEKPIYANFATSTDVSYKGKIYREKYRYRFGSLLSARDELVQLSATDVHSIVIDFGEAVGVSRYAVFCTTPRTYAPAATKKPAPTPNLPPILTAPPELAADVLGGGMGLTPTPTAPKRKPQAQPRTQLMQTKNFGSTCPVCGSKNIKYVDTTSSTEGTGRKDTSLCGDCGWLAGFDGIIELEPVPTQPQTPTPAAPKRKPKKQPAAKSKPAPDMPPILTAPPELAADVLGTGPMGLTPTAAPRRKPAARTTRKQPKKTAAAKTRKTTKKAAKPKAKKTAATPKLTASQREYLAIQGFVMVKRGGKYVRITG